jgi:hypothetical protein
MIRFGRDLATEAGMAGEGWRHVEVTDRHTAVDYAAAAQAGPQTRPPRAQ